MGAASRPLLCRGTLQDTETEDLAWLWVEKAHSEASCGVTLTCAGACVLVQQRLMAPPNTTWTQILGEVGSVPGPGSPVAALSHDGNQLNLQFDSWPQCPTAACAVRSVHSTSLTSACERCSPSGPCSCMQALTHDQHSRLATRPTCHVAWLEALRTAIHLIGPWMLAYMLVYVCMHNVLCTV